MNNARRTDPVSSHIAGHNAEMHTAPAQRIGVLAFVEQYPNKTSKWLGLQHEEYDRYVFARRLPELLKRGDVEVSGFGEGRQQLWRVV